jgi:hypothetical protein
MAKMKTGEFKAKFGLPETKPKLEGWDAAVMGFMDVIGIPEGMNAEHLKVHPCTDSVRAITLPQHPWIYELSDADLDTVNTTIAVAQLIIELRTKNRIWKFAAIGGLILNIILAATLYLI